MFDFSNQGSSWWNFASRQELGVLQLQLSFRTTSEACHLPNVKKASESRNNFKKMQTFYLPDSVASSLSILWLKVASLNGLIVGS
jgi:hypothetical protein